MIEYHLRPFRFAVMAAAAAAFGLHSSAGMCGAQSGVSVPASSGSAGHRLSLTGDRAYSLGELARLVRTGSGVDFYVERPFQDRRLFISAGTYDVPVLLKAVEVATGLRVRKLAATELLASPNPARLENPILSAALMNRLASDLEPVARGVDLHREGAPFDSGWFLVGRQLGFKDLSAEQQAYVRKALAYCESMGSSVPDDTPRAGHLREKRLEESKIRFGSSYLLAFDFYNAARQSVAADAMGSGFFFQVAYDYADQLDATP